MLLCLLVRAQSSPEFARINQLIADWKVAEATVSAESLLEGLERSGQRETSDYAQALALLAKAKVRAGRPLTETSALTDRSLALKKYLSNSELAGTWAVIGQAHYGASDYKASAADFEKTLQLVPDSIEGRNGLGQAIVNLQETKRATDLHQEAVRLAEKRYGVADRRTGISIFLLGNDFRIAGKLNEAEAAYNKAFQLFTALPPGSEMYAADAQQALGVVYRERGHSERALPLMLAAIQTYETVLGKQNKKLIVSLNNAGLAANTIGNYPLAMSLFGRNLEILSANKLSDTSVGATVRGNYGILLRNSGNLQAARDQYLAALDIQERVLGKEHPLVASVLFSLAKVLSDLGDDAEAELKMERASEISAKVLGPKHIKTLEADAARAILLANMGRVAEARDLAVRNLQQTEAVFGVVSDPTAGAVDALASVNQEARHFAEARDLYRRYIAIHEALDAKDSFWVTSPYLDLAIVEQELGNSEEALRCAERFDKMSRENFGSRYPNQAPLYEAKAKALLSLSRRKEAFEAALAGADAQQLQLRDLTAGLAEREALTLLRKSKDPWNFAFRIATAAKAEPGEAAELWDRLIRSRSTVLDTMSERSALSQQLSNSAAGGELQQKAAAVSQGREELAQAVLSSPSGGPQLYSERFRVLRTKLEQAERNLGYASRSFRKINTERAAGFAEIAKALPAGSGLIAYVQSGTRMAAFTLRAGTQEPGLVMLPDTGAVADLVKNWRQAIDKEEENFGRRSAEPDAAYRLAGALLRRAVWDLAVKQLAGVKRVYVVLAGVLQFVNLESLPVGKGSYLAELGLEIRVMGAERDLTATAKPRQKGELLALGNPAYSGKALGASQCSAGSFDALPGSGTEAKAVAAQWRASLGPAVDLEGAQATKATLREQVPHKRALHLATHGFFLPDRCSAEPGFQESPLLRSGLVLAGRKADAILTAEEAASLNLEGAELVVLSGCETGSGVLQLGEGVLGFRRAFRIAGADTVVSSLWPVRDHDTEVWMSAFYREFGKGASPQQAAHHAALGQLAARRRAGQSTNPYYWGAFLAVGTR
jgi:CHAT domain-containing protein/lipopolysaccharide biosynthesis regulator YciM